MPFLLLPVRDVTNRLYNFPEVTTQLPPCTLGNIWSAEMPTTEYNVFLSGGNGVSILWGIVLAEDRGRISTKLCSQRLLVSRAYGETEGL